MKALYFFALTYLCLFQPLFSFAQVHVRGYTRRDGTYVRPHQRTNPNSTVTDNYSYPGNYNPNTGKITGGQSYSPNTYSGGNTSGLSSPNYGYSPPVSPSSGPNVTPNYRTHEPLDFTPSHGGVVRFNTNQYGSIKSQIFGSTENMAMQNRAALITISKNKVRIVFNGRQKTYELYDIGMQFPMQIDGIIADGGCQSIGLFDGSNYFNALYCKYKTDKKSGQSLIITNSSTYEKVTYEITEEK